MADITNPHDRFFKEVLSREEVARDFMMHYLPSEVVALFDMGSLEIRKDSFVEKGLTDLCGRSGGQAAGNSCIAEGAFE